MDAFNKMRKISNAIGLLILTLILVACTSSSIATSSGTSTSEVRKPPTKLQPPEMVSELVVIDDEWYRYTNNDLGFSIDVPKMYYRGDADCYWNETKDDSSFRPLGRIVPVVVIEGQDRIFITSEFYSELTLPTQIPSGAGYRFEFDGCERVTNDFDRMLTSEETSYYWEIVVWDIASEADLEVLVDAIYGECFSVGEILTVEGRDYQQVRVQGDGKPVEESTCLLNGGYIFYYSPEARKAATWHTGQSYHFPADVAYGEVYDTKMVESFAFIED